MLQKVGYEMEGHKTWPTTCHVVDEKKIDLEGVDHAVNMSNDRWPGQTIDIATHSPRQDERRVVGYVVDTEQNESSEEKSPCRPTDDSSGDRRCCHDAKSLRNGAQIAVAIHQPCSVKPGAPTLLATLRLKEEFAPYATEHPLVEQARRDRQSAQRIQAHHSVQQIDGRRREMALKPVQRKHSA
mmetsp:Transcript_22359/g.68073  ORF Transcript_22359/g.68073 Transcript_22359/m.68073 type:complete len:184 (-) Transcript_22359:821-1372(-)